MPRLQCVAYIRALAISIAILDAPARVTAGAASPTVEALVARHISALGGGEALRSLHDFRIVLVYREAAFEARSSLEQARPFYRLVTVPVGPLSRDTVLEGYDGAPWEYYGDPGITLRTVGSAAAISRRNAHQFIDALVDASANGTKLAYLGEQNVDGRNAFKIRATYEDGNVDDLFVDATTYLIDALAQDLQVHAFGKDVHSHIKYDDYRPVGGVMMPFRTAQINDATGQEMNSSNVLSAEANVGLSAPAFSPPTLDETPLQHVLDAIYVDRDDEVGVVTTYRDYRLRFGDDPPTVDAINFIAYQCLKMGASKSAIALSRANVHDNPLAASAHFGLGRALAASGDVAEARSEFARALAIDPSYKRARDALTALPQPTPRL